MADKELRTRITASDETKGPIESATAGFESLTKKVEGLNKPLEAIKGLFVGIAATLVGEFVKSTIEAAAESEKAWARVGASVENAGISMRHVKGELDQLFTSMAKTTRFSDEELGEAFSTLLTTTNDYTGSVKNLELVANIATARQIDLASAATLVGKVMDGNTAMLHRFGIILREDGTDPMKQLQERFSGFAEKDAESLSGALARIANDWGEVKEAIGNALMGDSAKGGLAQFDTALQDLTSWISAHRGDIQGLASDFVDLGKAIGSAFSDLVKAGNWIMHAGRGPNPTATRGADWMPFHAEAPNTTNMMQESVQRAAEIDANARRAAAERAAAEAKKELEEIRKRLAETEGGVPLADLARTAPTLLGRVRVGKATDIPGVTNQLYQGGQASQFGAGLAGLLAGAQPKESPIGALTKAFTADLPKAIDVAQDSVRGFFSMWGDMIGTIVEHHGKLGKAILDTGKKAIGGVMMAQGQAALLKAAEAAAEGLWPPNPALLLKAGRLLGVGTAELALGSLLGGGGGGGSAGSGGGAGAVSSSSFSSSAPASTKGPITLYMPRTGMVVDANNKDSVAAFLDFLQQLDQTRQISIVVQ